MATDTKAVPEEYATGKVGKVDVEALRSLASRYGLDPLETVRAGASNRLRGFLDSQGVVLRSAGRKRLSGAQALCITQAKLATIQRKVFS